MNFKTDKFIISELFYFFKNIFNVSETIIFLNII